MAGKWPNFGTGNGTHIRRRRFAARTEHFARKRPFAFGNTPGTWSGPVWPLGLNLESNFAQIRATHKEPGWLVVELAMGGLHQIF